ncbi:platelet-activating factor acetylhydrolase, isoform II-domain-containing protein [Russula compacta]|nr:platelet-activating factor acetylhydrolase, isoform II-domain-containing protein [Russula compacta]
MLLEHPTGPYLVGATTFALPVRPSDVIGTATVRTETGQITPALRLEEVSFTAYYPASPTIAQSRWKWLDWLPRPLAETVRGYSRFAGIPAFILWPVILLFGSLLQVPAILKAPPLRRKCRNLSEDPTPGPMDQSTELRWPLVIFSHGLGGAGTTYSQLCTHLASSGKVVLAMEHRDGTSPISRPRSEKTGERSSRFYISPSEVIWNNAKEDASSFQDARFAFRAEQLELRKREIYLAYVAFRRLVVTGECGDLQTQDELPLDWESWAGDWVRCDEGVSLMGHSFGGTTVFSMLSEPSKTEDVSYIPVSHSLVLDPWLEPLSSPLAGPEPFANQHLEPKCPRLLIINGEGFTLWKDHFKRLEQLVPVWPGSILVTVVGARHIAFSDFPLLLPIPIRSPTARPIMNAFKTLALSFLDDTLPKAISDDMNTRKLEIKYDRLWFSTRKSKQRLVGLPGDIVIHHWGVEDLGAQEDVD